MADGLCAREIDNLRSALDWAFAPIGDVTTGVALTAAAGYTLWTRLSLPLECRTRVERALAAFTAASTDARREMKLQAALGASSELYRRHCARNPDSLEECP